MPSTVATAGAEDVAGAAARSHAGRPAAGVAALAVVVAVVLGVGVRHAGGTTMTWLYLIGVALGVVLFHSRYGFTSAWRQLVTVGQGKAIRAHMLMLAVAGLFFAPLLASGRGVGNVYPIGAGLVVGAVLFGIGMQLGGACASGTLFAVGDGPRGHRRGAGRLGRRRRLRPAPASPPAPGRRRHRRGVLMGYGARIANGCNIGAYFSGVASFSLAGWAWAALALGGTLVGVRLRPFFGFTHPKPTDSVC